MKLIHRVDNPPTTRHTVINACSSTNIDLREKSKHLRNSSWPGLKANWFRMAAFTSLELFYSFNFSFSSLFWNSCQKQVAEELSCLLWLRMRPERSTVFACFLSFLFLRSSAYWGFFFCLFHSLYIRFCEAREKFKHDFFVLHTSDRSYQRYNLAILTGKRSVC